MGTGSGSPPASGAAVGIDLGTTYSALARVSADGHVEVINNAEGEPITPSVVYFDEGETVLVGRDAARAALVEPEKGAECFKRDMGADKYARKVAGRYRRPELLSAIVLKKLKQDAERKIGPIGLAVITVPAYFDDNRRKATEDAGRIAGFEEVHIINEPTAAALYYGYHAKDEAPDGAAFMVCDLGGGTFDATLMRRTGPVSFETISTDGEVRLGGKNWDERLLNHVCSEFMQQMGSDPREDPLSYQDLVIHVEDAKKALSRRTSVSIPVTHAGRRMAVNVTREKFESLTSDLLQRVSTTVELMLDEAEIAPGDLYRFLLVGGSTRMPMIQDMARRMTGKAPYMGLEQDLAVAQGAALHGMSLRAKQKPGAAVVDDDATNRTLGVMNHSNVNSHSLGVLAHSRRTGQTRNVIVIPRNTPIPCAVSKTFGTARDNATSVRVRIVEGEAPDPEACTHIGKCRIEGLPPGLPKGSPIVVTFSYSSEGRVEVSAVSEQGGASASTTIDRQIALNEASVDRETETLSGVNIL